MQLQEIEYENPQRKLIAIRIYIDHELYRSQTRLPDIDNEIDLKLDYEIDFDCQIDLTYFCPHPRSINHKLADFRNYFSKSFNVLST